jgi:hypothetical protein
MKRLIAGTAIYLMTAAVLLAIYVGNGQQIDAESFEQPVVQPQQANSNPPLL